MKTLKLKPFMKDDLLSGKKTKTWRMFDDKDLNAGDKVEFIDAETKEKWVVARITNVEIKPFGSITDADFDGHNPYPSREIMLETYRGYYGERVTWETPIKMLTFALEKG